MGSARAWYLALAMVPLLGCEEGTAAVTAPASSAPAAAEPTDADPPTFPADAPLLASAPGRPDAEPRTVELHWPSASDDVGVIEYRIEIDGQRVSSVAAPAEQAELVGVSFATAHTFLLVAVDAAGNESSPLTTDDALAPSFPVGAEITHTIEGGRVTLEWPAAEDDVGVVAYSVQRGDDELVSLEPAVRRHPMPTDEAHETLTVVAMDAAGHKTRLAASPRLRAEVAQAQVAQLLLGAFGGGSTLQDVLAGGAVGGDIDDILVQNERVGVASQGGGALHERGGGSGGGTALGIGGLSRISPPPPDERARGRVTLGALQEASGPGVFDAQLATRLLRMRLSAMRACYERELRVDPGLTGRVTVTFTITPPGTVGEAHAGENTTGSATLALCVTSTVRRMRFDPGPTGGPVTYTYPLTFERGDGP